MKTSPASRAPGSSGDRNPSAEALGYFHFVRLADYEGGSQLVLGCGWQFATGAAKCGETLGG